MQSISLADELTLELAGDAGRRGRGRLRGAAGTAEREPRLARAARVSRAHRLGRAAAAPDDRQARSRSPPGWRRLGRRRRGAAAGAGTPSGLGDEPAAGQLRRRARRRRARAARARPLARQRRRRAPAGAARPATPLGAARAAAGRRALDGRRLRRGRPARRSPAARSELEQRRRALLAAWTALATGARGWLAARGELLHNDLQAAAVSLCPPIAEALAAAARRRRGRACS